MPDVSRRSREGAQAGARVRDCGGRGAGGARALGQSARGAEGRARDAAHQPSARLSHLRPGGRVRAPGLHVPGRARRGTLPRSQALQPRRGFRRRRGVRRQPLHSVHALRAVHGRRRTRSRPERERARRPCPDRQVRGRGPDTSVGRQRDRPLSCRRTALEGLAQQGARVGAGSHSLGVPELLARLQHDGRDARQRGGPTPPASERRREQILHVRPRASQLSLAQSSGSCRRATRP